MRIHARHVGVEAGEELEAARRLALIVQAQAVVPRLFLLQRGRKRALDAGADQADEHKSVVASRFGRVIAATVTVAPMSVRADPQACIITVAITGSLLEKKDNPAELLAEYGRRPATPAEARSILSL